MWAEICSARKTNNTIQNTIVRVDPRSENDNFLFLINEKEEKSKKLIKKKKKNYYYNMHSVEA